LHFAVPFELLLFSYAVLGPLYYLAEISWLHKKKYFILDDGKSVSGALFCVGIPMMCAVGPQSGDRGF
jgi:hypothetical protein